MAIISNFLKNLAKTSPVKCPGNLLLHVILLKNEYLIHFLCLRRLEENREKSMVLQLITQVAEQLRFPNSPSRLTSLTKLLCHENK